MAGPEKLALAFEQILTVTVRVRSNRQMPRNAAAFRAQVRGLLGAAERDALAHGYAPEDYRFAGFAVVAFLDESVLASTDPVFNDWKRSPLQQELFKTGNAGEEFFTFLESLQKRRDTPELADVLEVFYLCLLLGFRGRGTTESLRTAKEIVGERIRHIRGASQPLSIWWAPSAGVVQMTGPDPWARRLMIVAACCFVLAVGLFTAFKLLLAG